jgi:DNA-binding transcriptional MerR regulator
MGGSEEEEPQHADVQGPGPGGGGSTAELFQTRDVVELLGISRRQLQYWAKTDLITPGAQTPGGHARYTFQDLVALKAAKRLINAGVSVQRIRSSIRALRRMLPTVKRPLAELVLVATGDVVLAFRGGAAFDAISGQEWVLEVAQLQREVEAWKQSVKTLHAARRPRTVRPRVRYRTA